MLKQILILLFIFVISTTTQFYSRSVCRDGEITGFHNCSSDYQRCDGGRWNRNTCAWGVINPDTHVCEPFRPTCPEPNLPKGRLLRQKRQATVDCSTSYSCPTNLNSAFVYPYWSSCDSFVMCENGVLTIQSCTSRGYNYYNARTQSCEEFASLSNICVYRQYTDLSPVVP